MPTYLTWDREVLEECYDQVDGISLHAYYGNTPATSGNNSARYLAMNLDMDRHIHEIAAVCDYVQGLQKSSKRLWLSFDEWNVWYRARDRPATDGRRAIAPHLLEEVYNLEDALLVGGFSTRCSGTRIESTSPASRSSSTSSLRSWLTKTASCARARTIRMRGRFTTRAAACSISASSPRHIQSRRPACRPTLRVTSDVPFVDVVATLDEPNGQACLLMLNRDLEAARQVVLEWEDVTPTRVLGCDTITGTDLKAFNTIEQPNRVTPQPLSPPAAGSRMTFELPARSYTVARLAITVR